MKRIKMNVKLKLIAKFKLNKLSPPTLGHHWHQAAVTGWSASAKDDNFSRHLGSSGAGVGFTLKNVL